MNKRDLIETAVLGVLGFWFFICIIGCIIN